MGFRYIRQKHSGGILNVRISELYGIPRNFTKFCCTLDTMVYMYTAAEKLMNDHLCILENFN